MLRGGASLRSSSAVARSCASMLEAITPCSHSCSRFWPPFFLRGSAGNDVSLLQVALNGGLSYMWRYSGWTRRGRFLGYSEVIREVRRRIMRSHGDDYFYLLTYAHHPALSDADAAAQLAAVVKPVTDRVRWMGGAVRGARAGRAEVSQPPRCPAAPPPRLPSQADALAQPCYLELTNLVHVAMFEVRYLAPFAPRARWRRRGGRRPRHPANPRASSPAQALGFARLEGEGFSLFDVPRVVIMVRSPVPKQAATS